jgi:hypothetical protein
VILANSIAQEMIEFFIAQDIVRIAAVCATHSEIKNKMLTIVKDDATCSILKASKTTTV